MKIRLLTITHKIPTWVQLGYLDFSKRLPPHCSLELVEIPAEKRTPNANIKNILERESEKILKKIKATHHVIALTLTGKAWSSEELAQQLDQWKSKGCTIDLLVGGPEGLSPNCLQAAHEEWSLSTLTFPHPLVRLIIAEQIYRAWSILENHPYHR